MRVHANGSSNPLIGELSFSYAKNRNNLVVLSSILLKALAIDAAVFYAAGWMHIYEVYPRKDKRGIDLISDVLPFGRLWVRRTKRCHQCNRLHKVNAVTA